MKKEVRLVGGALLAALPLVWLAPMFVRSVPISFSMGSSHAVASASAASLVTFEPTPIVSLRLEPDSSTAVASPVSTAREPRSPVALRGDILPDDGSMEGSAHAGS